MRNGGNNAWLAAQYGESHARKLAGRRRQVNGQFPNSSVADWQRLIYVCVAAKASDFAVFRNAVAPLSETSQWIRPHPFNNGLAPAKAEKKLNVVSGISCPLQSVRSE
jgi:hypothetical protein